MPKKKTPSFIHELELKPTLKDTQTLEKRFDAGRRLYNACLGEILKRLRLMRQSKLYQQARKEKNKKKRTALFKKARELFGFSEYELHAFVTPLRKNSFIQSHIDSSTCQKIASRAFDAAQKYALGIRGKSRFKGKGRFNSLEGKSNKTGIRFINGKFLWSGLKIIVQYDHKDKKGVESHALNCKTKYVRIIQRNIKGKVRWFIQIIQEGLPKKKYESPVGSVGIDIGPSTLAVDSEKGAFIEPFCPDLDPIIEEKKPIQRIMDRSRRGTNPNNYNSDGTVKKGSKSWVRSRHYQKLQAKLAEKERVLVARRKQGHGNTIRKVLTLGNEIKIEKLSYKSFQRNFGKSVGARAPGMFVELLKRKAESAGGKVVEFSTRKTKLSQACHCGEYKKKPLSQRWHDCSCGVKAQRDLYSAFLAIHVENDSLDMSQASSGWASAEMRLEQAIEKAKQSAISKKGSPRAFSPASLGLNTKVRADRLLKSERNIAND